MELYTGSINEFVDWVDGSNSLTGRNDTNGKPVAGSSIRSLLQDRLKEPIVIYRDRVAKLYRVFSSQASKTLWENNPVKYSNLELANFVAPSEYIIEYTLKDNKESRYIRSGVRGQAGSKWHFEWEIKNDREDESIENLYVTFKIQESGITDTKLIKASDKDVTIDLYDYLGEGQNTIDINLKGSVSGAESNKQLTITTVKLDIRTDLNTYNVLTNGNALQFGMYASRNITGSLVFLTKRYYYGGNMFNTEAQGLVEESISIPVTEDTNLNPSVTYKETGNAPLPSGLHVIQVVARMDIENQEFYSNMLYYLVGANKTIEDAMTDDRITFMYEYNDNHNFISDTGFIIPVTQYESSTLNWSYIRLGTDNRTKTIRWYIRKENSENSEDYQETYLNEFTATSGQQAPKLTFSPSQFTTVGYNDYLVAKSTSGQGSNEIIKIPLYIQRSSLDIGETTGINLKLKLSAFGKSNDSESKNNWSYISDGNTYSTPFTGISWNDASGWYNNSLRLSGTESYATINYNPFLNTDMVNRGITVEVDFESEYVSSTSDTILRIGGPSTYIKIQPNKAQMIVDNNPLITTNYKANERVKLAFIVNPEDIVSDEIKKVAFIVNNGICERGAGWGNEINSTSFEQNSGNIKIGGSASGIRLYSIRCYNAALTVLNAFNNYVFDSDNKDTIVQSNDIFTSGVIDITKCQDKIDIIKITGDLTNVLSRGSLKENSNCKCDIERISKDSTKNFKVEGGRIRKHGQSTLTYPLTSYKIWLNSSTDNTTPTLTIDGNSDVPFTKNRYQMKDDSIPANKFVLQANYADSSGVHNGGLQRLIQQTWYDAVFPDGEYKLRTPPQLFMSNKTISRQSVQSNGETITDSTPENSEADLIFRGYNSAKKQWKDYFGEAKCPYTVRNSADSFPCLVFYRNTAEENSTDTLLGQYVFMDDKKSDFVYGERSIYYVEDPQTRANNAGDPFCLRKGPSGNSLWNEKSGTKIWDNYHVLRIEGSTINSTLADFRGTVADNSKRRYDDFISGSNEYNTSIGWEEDFELIYPDKEDITSDKKFSADKFHQVVTPFTNWLGWLISTYKNQSKFEAEAASHIDLYKMAAYYIFILRFGLVDSSERNAQIKTYDGVHFHYEPWDMDIALGNRNTGGIAFDPPITRETKLDDTTAAISGWSVLDTNNDEIPDTIVSNWLFDALESWDYFMNVIVKETSDALYNAGLTYQKSIRMFDENYQNAWCERIYNYSGNFKYVVNRHKVDDDGNVLDTFEDSWLDWLQGARTTHRHWWLKTSMDYYDAKFGVGEFMQRRVYLACEMHNRQGTINIKPISDTYFSFTSERDTTQPYDAPAATGLQYSVASRNTGAKVPFYINGANFIKELDISIVADGLQTLQLDGAYSAETGPIITKLNMGVRFTSETDSKLIGQLNGKSVNFMPGYALNAIEELNVRGQHGGLSLGFLRNTKTIKRLYGAGANFGSLSTASGTNYEILELPDTVTSITFTDTKWSHSNLSFWTVKEGGFEDVTYNYDEPQYNAETGEYFTQETVREYKQAEYNKYTLPGVTQEANSVTVAIPRTLSNVVFNGTTGRELCSRQFFHDWIYSIIDQCTYDWNDSESEQYTEAHEFESLDDYIKHTFGQKRLSIKNIYWDNTTIPGLSYLELSYMAMFNGIDYDATLEGQHPNIANFSKGYVMLLDSINGMQASQLSTWFGASVFTLNGDGLTIDNVNDITTISVGPNARVIDGNVYLREGESARLYATQFRLQPISGKQTFTFRNPNNISVSLGTTYTYPLGADTQTCAIIEQYSDGDYYYYIETTPNTAGEDYEVVIGSGNTTQTIYIQSPDYPQKVQLGIEIDDNMQSSRGGSTNDPKSNSYTQGNISYYKQVNAYTVANSGTNIIVGLQFKENGKWYYDIQNKEFKTTTGDLRGYVAFKVYKNGVLSSKFSTAKYHTEFTEGNATIANNIEDVYLQYYTGYNKQSTPYKYFIPLCVGTNPAGPIKYTIEAEVKIGGKIDTIRQDIVVSPYEILAPQGTTLWGILDGGFYSAHGEHFEQSDFTYALSPYITGTIGIGGVYYQGIETINVSDDIASLTTICVGTKSLLRYLPYITGINFTGASSLTSTVEIAGSTIYQMDFFNTTRLKTLSIKDCTSLSETIDLLACPDLEEVDARNTNLNVMLPPYTGITSLKLGSPTSIEIDNPTILTIDNIQINDKSRITSVIIRNIKPSVNRAYNFLNSINLQNLNELIIEQDIAYSENVNNSFIVNIYEIINNVLNNNLNVNIQLSGNISVQSALKEYKTFFDNIGSDSRFSNFFVNVTNLYTKVDHVSSNGTSDIINVTNDVFSGSFDLGIKFKVTSPDTTNQYFKTFVLNNTAISGGPRYIYVKGIDVYITDLSGGTGLIGHSMCSVGDLEEGNYHFYSENTTNSSISLFGLTDNNNRASGFSAVDLYYFKVYKNGSLKVDLIPCKSSSNQPGLYDNVSGTFYSGISSYTDVQSQN